MKPVEVAAKSLLQHREHKNRPQFHPRTADLQIAIFPEPVQQKLENRLPQRLIQIQALQAKQDCRDVVPRLHVNLDSQDLRLSARPSTGSKRPSFRIANSHEKIPESTARNSGPLPDST